MASSYSTAVARVEAKSFHLPSSVDTSTLYHHPHSHSFELEQSEATRTENQNFILRHIAFWSQSRRGVRRIFALPVNLWN
jgi:hypothetical protein